VPGTLLALWGIAVSIRQKRYFWPFAVLVFTVLALGNQGPLAGIIYRTPILNLFRTMAANFEIAHLALCLLAAVGADCLLSHDLTAASRRIVIAILAALAMAGIVGAWPGVTTAEIPGWWHALAVLLLFWGIMLARFRNYLSPPLAASLILALIGFDLWFYNSNQAFNTGADNPATFLSADFAAGHQETVRFLRSDAGHDFRVTALGEYQWSGNGWSVWRIPGITGVNPVTLRRYHEYQRLFGHGASVRQETEPTVNQWDSPLLDLLGVKYFVVVDSMREAVLGSASSKLRHVFDEMGWWHVYRNDAYLPHAWFFPRAYQPPAGADVYALLKSGWFDPRRTVLLEPGALPEQAQRHVEPLPVETLYPGGRLEIRGGRQLADPYCAQPLPIVGGWGSLGDRMQFQAPASGAPARYHVLLRYTVRRRTVPSLGMLELVKLYPWYLKEQPHQPQLAVSVASNASSAERQPVSLTWTQDWPCHESGVADLGEINASPGENVTITSLAESSINIYGAWLLRIPEAQPEPRPFAFRGFDVSANRIAFEAEVGEAGFLFLNEVYYPGWQASVNGHAAEMHAADGVFRALYVEAGTHSVELIFRPPHFRLGATISALTLVCFLVCAGVSLRRRRLSRSS
jgi:hypothetical protein